jgi:hypothetical protein
MHAARFYLTEMSQQRSEQLVGSSDQAARRSQ